MLRGLLWLFVFASAQLLHSARAAYLSVKWSRPRVTYDGTNYGGFANSFDEFIQVHKVVKFDICDSEVLKKYPRSIVNWQFRDLKSYPEASSAQAKLLRERIVAQGLSSFNTTQTCKIAWRAPRESRFSITVRVYDEGRLRTSKQLYIDVEDIWLVAIGDSFVSGEGNPDVRSQFLVLPRWIDGTCSRSASGSFAYMTYQEVEQKYKDKGIMFTFLACSGASINEGLLGDYQGFKPQLWVLYDIKDKLEKGCCESCCKLLPDAVIMGIGGNDLEFSGVVKTFLIGLADSHYRETPDRLKKLDKKLDVVAKGFQDLGLDSNAIFYVEYFDPLRNQNGALDSSCKQTGVADDSDFVEVNTRVFLPLNRLMKKKSRQHSWTFVDGVDEAFRTHGLCSNERWIRTIDESINMQVNAAGAFHPTYEGHKATANLVWRSLEPYLKAQESKPTSRQVTQTAVKVVSHIAGASATTESEEDKRVGANSQGTAFGAFRRLPTVRRSRRAARF